MQKLLPLAGLAAVLVLALMASNAGAARIVFHGHDSGTDTFSDQLCGIDGTFVSKFVDDVQVFADNTFKDQFLGDTVFTATASGKSVELFSADQASGPIDAIDNGDGTITFVTTFKGLPEFLKIPNGPVLSSDVGTITIYTTFDAATGDFISQTFSGEHGPHPEADSGFTLFCDVIVPALS
jgi:hypothetical protein